MNEWLPLGAPSIVAIALLVPAIFFGGSRGKSRVATGAEAGSERTRVS